MSMVDAKKVIVELVEALRWCSGSGDFAPPTGGGLVGRAWGGWSRLCQPAISLGGRVVKAMPDGVMVEIEQTEAEKKDPSIFATMAAATAWCKPETEKIQMDPILAKAFAEVIDEIVAKKEAEWAGPKIHPPAPEEPIA